jgi:hypothetical protein
MDDPEIFRKLLELAEAEAAKRGLADAPRTVERVVVYEGSPEHTAAMGDNSGNPEALQPSRIVRVIVKRRDPSELASLRTPLPPGPDSVRVAERLAQEQKPKPWPKDPITHWLEEDPADRTPWSPITYPKYGHA